MEPGCRIGSVELHVDAAEITLGVPTHRLTSQRVSENAHDEDRLARDRERSTEAHWRAAEEAAESEPTQTPDVEDDARTLVQPEKNKKKP